MVICVCTKNVNIPERTTTTAIINILSGVKFLNGTKSLCTTCAYAYQSYLNETSKNCFGTVYFGSPCVCRIDMLNDIWSDPEHMGYGSPIGRWKGRMCCGLVGHAVWPIIVWSRLVQMRSLSVHSTPLTKSTSCCVKSPSSRSTVPRYAAHRWLPHIREKIRIFLEE